MKESGKDRLKYAVNESTLSTADAVPPSPNHHALRHHCERKRISAIIRVETTT